MGAPKAANTALTEILADGTQRALASPGGMFPVVAFSDKAAAVRIANSSDNNLFYQVTEAGFDLNQPQAELKNQLEVQREYRGEDGKTADKAKIGSNLEVHVKVRALKPGDIWNVAIVDMLPGGFEVVMDPALREQSMPASHAAREAEPCSGEGDCGEGDYAPAPAAPGGWRPDYVDIREDRIVIFGSAAGEVREFVYKIRATNAGTFTVPPVFAESMYDRKVQARGLGGKLTVE